MNAANMNTDHVPMIVEWYCQDDQKHPRNIMFLNYGENQEWSTSMPCKGGNYTLKPYTIKVWQQKQLKMLKGEK